MPTHPDNRKHIRGEGVRERKKGGAALGIKSKRKKRFEEERANGNKLS
jgi:hypothetical protein